jgi:Lar family restriction alleviation protein
MRGIIMINENTKEGAAALKSCPFCGESATLHEASARSGIEFVVICDGDDCGIESGGLCETREQALRNWNRRI